MSSGRETLPGDAILYQGDHAEGPLLMPPTHRESFVEEFNRTYRSINLSITIRERDPSDQPEDATSTLQIQQAQSSQQ
ncbi:hypothetical protein RISK_003192 [Rhodopirellula islandica]|uniref:Uncharacterized protein n=1 Tax=Rhodopirellula islandica TaxID=595434 RepID=A0A0J1EHD5_RHOIS|nr:hypothetical protein [Rhodopirellula islandica]KLU04924.1 hypothetical protein RISK_003192 [Rhodopirellula islandica]